MTDKRLGTLTKNTQSAANTAGYSKLVRLLRFSLPLFALIILAVVLSWGTLKPEIIVAQTEELSVADISKNELIKPRFESRDDKNQPYIITADKATQSKEDEDLIILENPSGEITLTSKAIIALQAALGAFEQRQQYLILKDKTKLAHSNGYVLDTEKLHIDIKNNKAWTDTDVRVEGQEGNIIAKGLEVDQTTQALKFIGPAKLMIKDGQLKI